MSAHAELSGSALGGSALGYVEARGTDPRRSTKAGVRPPAARERGAVEAGTIRVNLVTRSATLSDERQGEITREWVVTGQ